MSADADLPLGARGQSRDGADCRGCCGRVSADDRRGVASGRQAGGARSRARVDVGSDVIDRGSRAHCEDAR